MYYYEVAPNQIIRADSAVFTYSSDTKLPIGQIVIIEIGKKSAIGVVFKGVSKPPFDTKPIKSIIDGVYLPKPLIELSTWLSGYYMSPLANVLQTILPRGIQKNRRQALAQTEIAKRKRTNILFNKEQSAVIDQLETFNSGTFLLQGVTGSGKTEIYIDQAKKTIANGKSVVIIVPEIALSSQIVSEFSNHFNDIILTHSKMTESARHQAWLRALENDTQKIVIGPRSALFMPLKNIGLIVVDEAHEPSLKQEQTPKYSALRAATMLGRFHKAKVIFGSATPSISDRYLAEQSDHPILSLTKPARIKAKPPEISVIDMRKRENFKNHRFLSDKLISEITNTLKNKRQILIFHNRRGSTSSTLCEKCGWTAQCQKCFLPLNLHSDNHNLICHVCGSTSPVLTSCPICNSANIIHKGIGTKLIESEIKKMFPEAKIARFDADNKHSDSLDIRYKDIYDGKIDIIIGTQIVAKGLDLPHLRTVAVIQADTGLSLPDFNTNERVFQLLTQVVGRVGRDEHQTQVIVQSFQPDHPSVVYGLNQDYESFYRENLSSRKRGLFPPFAHLLKLTCVYKTEKEAILNARKLAATLRQKSPKDVQILGPTPAFYERQHNTYRWQLVVKSPKRQNLIDTLKLVPPNHWQSELDPTSLL